METTTAGVIQRAVTRSHTPAEAARELRQALGNPRSELVILFVDPEYDLGSFGLALAESFGDVPLIGCTTAGEITPTGYEDGCAVAVNLPSEHFVAATGALDGLAKLETAKVQGLVSELMDSIRQRGAEPTRENTFALLLIDGLSGSEEVVVSMLSGVLGEISLFGGSAGDGLKFRRTEVMHGGEFRTDRAVLALIQTDLPFAVFKTQHFVPSPRRMVVTGAEVQHRRVTEINGEPAGREYARMVGVALSELTPVVFATSPVVVRIGRDTYVRSIQKLNEDDSLTFYCAIDEGIVLSLGDGLDLIEHLKASFEQLRLKVGPFALVLGCDCILRKLEVQRKEISGEIGRILAENHVIGFSTYGEQWNGVHVNQTLTGVAIGTEPRPHV